MSNRFTRAMATRDAVHRDWHPSQGPDTPPGPSDTILTKCEECGKFVEGALVLHVLARHPTGEAAEKAAEKRAYENERNAIKRGRRRQLRLDLDL